jgi:hypothetical protein
MDDQAQDMTNHTSKINLTSKNKTSARTKKRALLSLSNSHCQPDWFSTHSPGQSARKHRAIILRVIDKNKPIQLKKKKKTKEKSTKLCCH